MSGDYVLAYDADCGPCTRFKAVVDFLDARGLIEFASLRQAEQEGTLDVIDSSLRYGSFHLIERGQGARSGADALLPLVKVLFPGSGAVSKALEDIPGCRRAISFGYSVVLRLHDSGACSTAVH